MLFGSLLDEAVRHAGTFESRRPLTCGSKRLESLRGTCEAPLSSADSANKKSRTGLAVR